MSRFSTPTPAPRARSLLDVPAPLLVLGIATVAGLLFTAQIYFSWAIQGKASWGQSMYWAFGDWFEWALLSPAIFWICGRFPFSRGVWPWSLAVMVAVAVIFAVVHVAMCAAAAVAQGWVTGPATSFTKSFNTVLAARTPFNLVVFAAIVCAWHLWQHYRRVREREAELAELKGQLAEAQLFALRMQLNPHFLYNTLNAISSLMLTDVTAANRMLSRLGALLRGTLETGAAPEISLEQELTFLRGYLEIEQIRFGDRLQVSIEPEAGALEAAVPNFILQPLVENALRHAIDHREAGGQIRLCASRDATGSLVLSVADNGPDAAARESANQTCATRIGLQNTRQRLETLYGATQRLELEANDLGGMTARLAIPFRPLAAAATP